MSQKLTLCVVVKGEYDMVLHGSKRTVIITKGSKKRCGGIGDVLAGCIATCSFWDFDKGPALACHIVKCAADKAFICDGRSLTGLGVLEQINNVIKLV